MEAGDKVRFPFAKGEKEGVVVRVTPKKVYIKVDFPHHQGKIIKRSLHQVKKI